MVRSTVDELIESSIKVEEMCTVSGKRTNAASAVLSDTETLKVAKSAWMTFSYLLLTFLHKFIMKSPYNNGPLCNQLFDITIKQI
jgi:hypothetical protein